ncbi:hypothetical protein [Paenibacillus radicis (ex Gao et al. 2016)]|uniref:Uncharacterized protein n=1 Tax=Paenibacillus radicis (ex Gao et al. 2016) TaxID=1737354 RepID=A0A917HV16_9BACL|nr:hypothetical protein [Paenibacillus radicis (ex Gao et al. 2016)]GGG89349.1 hypothetical protein GCM10010918_55110 [Paenibacillus radicis (ex Gao et al. 2016)]
MNGNAMTIENKAAGKIEILRDYEQYCYQVVYYLIQDEAAAAAATCNALLSIYANEAFFSSTQAGQQEVIKQAAMREALQAFKQSRVELN